MKYLFLSIFCILIHTLSVAQTPEYYTEFSNPKFEGQKVTFDIKLFALNHNIHVLSGNIRYNFDNTLLNDQRMPEFYSSIQNLEKDAISFLNSGGGKYVNIGFSTSNFEGVEIPKNGLVIGKVVHDMNGSTLKKISDIVNPRVYNVEGYTNQLPLPSERNCTKLFTTTSPYKPVQAGIPVNKVYLYSDLNINITEIDIYPNPTTHVVNYNLSSDVLDEKASATVLNTEGRLVSSFLLKGQNQGVIDFSSYSSGVYYIWFENGNQIEKHKVIKI